MIQLIAGCAASAAVVLTTISHLGVFLADVLGIVLGIVTMLLIGKVLG